MEHAKKLILIEPRVLEQLQSHREYKELQKASDVKSKANLSLDLQKLLEDSSIDDDVKAKLYSQSFTRFRNLTDSIPEQRKVSVNSLTAPLPRPKKKKSKAVAWSQY